MDNEIKKPENNNGCFVAFIIVAILIVYCLSDSIILVIPALLILVGIASALYKKPLKGFGLWVNAYIGIFVLLICIVVGVYYYSIAESQRHPKQEAVNTETPSETTTLPLSYGPGEILRNYDANEVKADELYRGKRIKTYGVVRAIKKDFLNHSYVLIQPHLIDNEFFGIQCYFDNENLEQAANVHIGQSITVEGIGGPFNMTATLYHASIVN